MINDAFNGPAEGSEWGHLIIQAKWLQPVMWEELNYSIMHRTLREKKKSSWQQAQHVWVWKYLHRSPYLGWMSEWSFSNVSWQRVFSPLACNLFSHALSVAGSQLRFLIHNEHGRRQSGKGRGWRGWERQPLTHNIVPTAKQKTKNGMWVQNVILAFVPWPVGGHHICCLPTRKPSLTPSGLKTDADPDPPPPFLRVSSDHPL